MKSIGEYVKEAIEAKAEEVLTEETIRSIIWELADVSEEEIIKAAEEEIKERVEYHKDETIRTIVGEVIEYYE